MKQYINTLLKIFTHTIINCIALLFSCSELLVLALNFLYTVHQTNNKIMNRTIPP